MRLITHNMLICNKKDVINGFPLKIVTEEIEIIKTDYNKEFIIKLLHKIDWKAFIGAVHDIQNHIHANKVNIPDTLNDEIDSNDEMLQCIHHLLLEVHVKKGKLVCPESGREFHINDGIPNMLLREDEI